MTNTGMIYQFNQETGSGLIMLSDGSSIEFSKNEWSDETSEPAVGMKIVYAKDNANVNIMPYDENSQQESSVSPSVDEYVEHFKEEGFNLFRDTSEGETRTAILRKYEMQDHSHIEVTIKRSNNDTTVTKTINGVEVK